MLHTLCVCGCVAAVALYATYEVTAHGMNAGAFLVLVFLTSLCLFSSLPVCPPDVCYSFFGVMCFSTICHALSVRLYRYPRCFSLLAKLHALGQYFGTHAEVIVTSC